MLPVAHAQNDVPIHPVDGQYITEWLVLGPFFPDDLEKDFLVDVGGEAHIEPKEGDTVVTAQGDTLTWKRYQTQGSLIDLTHAVGNYLHATAYAFCTLRSEAEEKVKILLGSDDGASVWINGQQVHHNPVDRPLTPDEDMFEADFLAGANRCLVKVSNGLGHWDFSMRAFPHNQLVLGTPKFFLSSDHLKDEIWLDDRLWKYHQSDNTAWANPEFDDSEWETTNTQLDPNNLPKSGWNGIGWFRLHVVVDSTLWNRPLALNVWQVGASEIYLDGRLVAQFGKVGSSKRDEEGYVTINTDFLPPPKSIVFGKTDHVIAVRFSNFNFTEKYPQLGQGFRIVLSDLNSAIASSASQRMVTANIRMVLTIVPLVFAILHLLLFLFYQRAKENLYYALFTSMLGAVFFIGLQTEFSLVTDLRQTLLLLKLVYTIFTFMLIAGLRFSYALFYPRLPKQFWIFLLIATGIVTWLWALPFREHILYDVFNMITLLEMLRIAVVAIRRKRDGAWIIGAGFTFFTVLFLWIIADAILAKMDNLPELSTQVGLALVSSGIFGLLLSMSVFLSRNFARTSKNLERQSNTLRQLNLELEDRVEERTAELAEANDALETKNAQLSESYGKLDSAHTQLQETQTQLVQSEKMAALGNLVAGIAHEMNTPVGAVNSAADVSNRAIHKIKETLGASHTLDDIQNNKPFRRALKALEENNQVTATASHRISKLVMGLKNFARLDEAEFQKADIHEGIDSTLTLVQHELKNRITVNKQYGDIPQIYCYPNQLNQVFMNLFVNAARAIEDQGMIQIKTSADKADIYIVIADTGRGIPSENLNRIFEPGFTTKGSGVGTGLGLSISYNIIQKHGGKIEVESEVGRGTTFVIILPIVRTETEQSENDVHFE